MGEDTFKFVMVMLIVAGCVVLYFAPEPLCSQGSVVRWSERDVND